MRKKTNLVLFVSLLGTLLQTAQAHGPAAVRQFFEDFTVQKELSSDVWFLEGTGQATIEDGTLQLSESPDGVGAVLWLKQDWPEAFHLALDVAFNNNKGIGVIFFAAKGSDGSDALMPETPRTGAYDEYIRGVLDSYSLSFHRYWPDGRNNPGSNLRRNSGFHLIHQCLPDPCLQAGQTYHIEIIKLGASIKVLVNGEVTHEGRDNGDWGPPLQGGKIGFRIRGDASCVMTIDNIKIQSFAESITHSYEDHD